MPLRPPFFPGPPPKAPPRAPEPGVPARFDPLPDCDAHSSKREGRLHARLRLLREARVEQGGAVLVDLDRASLPELLFAERPAGKDGHGTYSCAVRRLDVPDGVPDGHRLVRRGAGPLQRELEDVRSEEHTSELQSRQYLVCRLLLEKKNGTSPYPFLSAGP